MTSSPPCSSPTPTRRFWSSPRRHGLQAQDLAPALGLPRLARQGHREHPADRARDRHRRHHARRPGRGSLGRLQIVFATSAGDVRRNALSDFTNVMRNGKIAMKLPEGRRLVNARICSTEADDVMLVTAQGPRDPLSHHRCPRLQGPRFDRCAGHRLAEGDRVVSMAVIRHFEASPEERAAYLKMRRLMAGVDRRRREPTRRRHRGRRLHPRALCRDVGGRGPDPDDHRGGSGKLGSSHDYPVRGRGGQGVRRWTRRCGAARWWRASR
jgi:DNA gyrase/topoisomerase IV subunit A